MITLTVVKIIINSSYVLIDTTTFVRPPKADVITLPVVRLSILYCHGAAVSRFEIEKQVAFKMRMLRNVSYAYPEVNKVDIPHLK